MIHKMFFVILFALSAVQIGFAQDKKPADCSLEEIEQLLEKFKAARKFELLLPYAEAGLSKAEAKEKNGKTHAKMLYYMGFGHQVQRKYKEAESYLKQAAAIQQQKAPKAPDYAATLNNLGILYYETGNYDAGEKVYKEALQIRKESLGVNHPEYASSLNNLANLYRVKSNFAEAEPLLLEAIKIKKASGGDQSPDYARALNNLSNLYRSMGEYALAEPILKEALNIKKAEGENPDYASSLNNLGSLYARMQKYDAAEAAYKEAVSILEKTAGKEHPEYAKTLNNLALLYQKMGKNDLAKALSEQTCDLLLKSLGEKHPEYAKMLSSSASLHHKTGDFEEAEKLYLKAWSIRKESLGETHRDYVESCNILAEFYQSNKIPEKAAEYMQKALLANSGHAEISPNKAELFRFHDEAVSSLDVAYRLYSDNNNKAAVISETVLLILREVVSSISDEEDKLRALSMLNDWTLRVLKHTESPEKAFVFAEQSKGILLAEALRSGQAFEIGNLPSDLAQKEKELQKQKAGIEAALAEKRNEEERNALTQKLNALNAEIKAFRKELETKYPKYAALKYEQKSITKAELQSILGKESALLEYVVGPASVYVFYADNVGIKRFELPFDNKELKAETKLLHTILSSYKQVQQQEDTSVATFIKHAQLFYKRLLEPVLKEAKGIKRLIIIPDAELAYLPFEVFLTESPAEGTSFAKMPYLLNKYSISYNYSATLLKENQNNGKNRNNGKMLAIAARYTGNADSVRSALRLPVYRRMRQILNDLPAARKEVEALQKQFDGLFAFDNEATERNFKSKAQGYAVIHLAMHGLLDGKNPALSSLAFSEDGDSSENNFLQAYEISKMELNADLVVLSACETGYGKFEAGNGTASLARAFMYAGAQSLVVSLWQVNDASTSAIMQLFYKNLAKGMNKAEALQDAKLKYISTVDNPAATHPAFWAPFILIGDERPIAIATKGGGTMWWIVGGILIIATVGGFFALRNRKK